MLNRDLMARIDRTLESIRDEIRTRRKIEEEKCTELKRVRLCLETIAKEMQERPAPWQGGPR